jgi:hypothetical protein
MIRPGFKEAPYSQAQEPPQNLGASVVRDGEAIHYWPNADHHLTRNTEMPVNLNAGNAAYSVNNSRIQKFLTAENRNAALHMGGWDRFKDYFRADNDKKATKIAAIYDSIVAAAPQDRTPLNMLDRFHALKRLAASPPQQAQFRVSCTAPRAESGAGSTWSYGFSIGDTRIHETGDIPDVHESLAKTFQQAMMVKELEHHIDALQNRFQVTDSARHIDDQYFKDKTSMMAHRSDDGAPLQRLRENLDDGFFCGDNLKSVARAPNGGPLVATFSTGEGNRTETLEFNAKSNPQDPLQPCGAKLEEWLNKKDFSSIRNMIEKKAKSVEDSKSVNDFSSMSMAVLQKVGQEVGKPIDAMSLIRGSAQTELAEAIREVYQARPESATPTIAKLFNMKIEGYTDQDPDFAVRNFLGEGFCRNNPEFLTEARQVATQVQQTQAANVDDENAPLADILRVPDLRAPEEPADKFLATHLVNYRKMNILGTVVGGGARPEGKYLTGATQDEVLAQIKAAGFTTILSIDQNQNSRGLAAAISKAGLNHEIDDMYEFPDWDYSTPGLYANIKNLIETKAAQGERVFIHCGAGNGRTGTVLSALVLSDLIAGEQSRRQDAGKSFDLADYRDAPKVNVSTKYVVPRDGDNNRVGNAQEQETSFEIPYLAAHAVLAVRNAAMDNPIEPGEAVETNEQLLDVVVFAQHLLPPPPAMQAFA